MDLNGDKILDAVTGNAGTATFSVLLGDGKGGFGAKTDTSVAGITTLTGVAMADFNNDTRLDVAVTGNGSTNVAIRYGDGAGGFSTLYPGNVTVGNNPTFLTAADFNGDKNVDLAVSCPGSNYVSVRMNDGKGGFTGTLNLAGVNGAAGIVAADADRDGKIDLVVSAQALNQVHFFSGKGDGTFGALQTTATGGNTPIGLAVVDVNLDGKLDVVVPNSGNNNIAVLLGSGVGTFAATPGSPFPTSTQPSFAASADLNGDGLPDVITSNAGAGSLTVLLQVCQ